MEEVNLSSVTPAAEDDGTPGCIITTAPSSMFVSNSFLLHDLQLWSLPSLWQDVIRHTTPPPVLLCGLARPHWQQLTLVMQLDAHWLDLLLVLHASRPQQRRGGLIRRRSGRSLRGSDGDGGSVGRRHTDAYSWNTEAGRTGRFLKSFLLEEDTLISKS